MIALERHRLAFGAYPESIDKLTPDEATRDTRDVFDSATPDYELISAENYSLSYLTGEGVTRRLWFLLEKR
jgi:hypothetical protein